MSEYTNMPKSLDPRMNRAGLVPADESYLPAVELDQFQTFEVFHQRVRGEHHTHVGSVHAPNAEMALLFAKEQYARRSACVNLWVVKTSDVTATEYEDETMFQPSFDKNYREANYYKNREVIDEFKRRMDAVAEKHFSKTAEPTAKTDRNTATTVTVKPTTGGVKKPTIVIAKKR